MKNLLVMISLALLPGLALSANEKRKPSSAAASFKVHACEQDALKRADQLLRFHWTNGEGGDIENFSIENKVEKKAPLKAPVGKGKFDVLEVTGYVYKAEYRMRFLYAQIKDACALMGQEVLEMSNPY